jgi:predicted small secreted protein
MKRTILVIISSLLLLTVVLAGCEGGGIGTGKMVCVWPKAALQPYANPVSRIISGLNWTNVEYTGTQDVVIPTEYTDVWDTW